MLTAAYGFLSGNWWHNCFPRQLMIEKAIGSEEFTTSLNYTVAGGELIRIGAFQKIPDGHRKTNFTVDWEPYDNIEDSEPADFRMPSQATKDRMAEAARLIGANHGYVRVDFLLDDEDQPYLGELTFTPGNALTIITPDVERELGAKWDWDAMVR
jgi:D-alanine-D-alanine ligase-like ATP-grasp enzyme